RNCSDMPEPIPAPRPAAPSTGFDVKRLYHTIMERLWLVAICLVMAVLLTIGYIQRQPILYASNAVVQVEQDEARVVKVEKFSAEDLRFPDALRTIEQTLKSRAVLERVAESLKLKQEPSFFSMTEMTKEQIAGVLDRIVGVRLRKGTRLLDVTATHPNRELAA